MGGHERAPPGPAAKQLVPKIDLVEHFPRRVFHPTSACGRTSRRAIGQTAERRGINSTSAMAVAFYGRRVLPRRHRVAFRAEPRPRWNYLWVVFARAVPFTRQLIVTGRVINDTRNLEGSAQGSI